MGPPNMNIVIPTKLVLIFPLLFTLASAQTEPEDSNRLGPLTPPSFNVAEGRKVTASSTCGEVNGRPIREVYCTIAGANPYTPYNQYTTYQTDNRHQSRFREMRTEASSFIQGGQNCDFCEAGTGSAHPASYLVDGTSNWYQSPPLSRGMMYSEVNITIDLEQEFQIVSLFIQMANSPRPGTWILERSDDFGITFKPWQFFAPSPAECTRMFGINSVYPIMKDDDVVCTTEYSHLLPMENGEMLIHLIEGRPSKNNFGGSPVLKQFVKATNVRLRLLKPKTMQGHLMDLHSKDDVTADTSVTRRYYYGIKEVHLFGRCICNGHGANCEAQDPSRPRARLCLCKHNTDGDQCQRCQAGFMQKKWRPSHEGDPFVCEPCNCHGHSSECIYEEELDEKKASLDIYGKFAGGGRCQNCQHNTKGINCNQCTAGFYRPNGKEWSELDVCQPCRCDPTKHTGNCAESTGQCECLPQFTGPNCDQCSPGYYHPPECRPCDCHVNGTEGSQCLPDRPDGQCPCKDGFAGRLCDKCAAGYANITADCAPCGCDAEGSVSSECDVKTTACACKSNFGGLRCEQCAKGYYKHPQCQFCDCDPSGTEDQVCDSASGQCLCKAGFAGRRCDRCDDEFYGYPNCRECSCHEKGSKTKECDQKTGECPCFANFTGRTCDKCSAGHYRFPDCLACDCFSAGSKGLTCDFDGQCYCRENFEGKRCERCMPNFFNWPVCEECNCHPSGVVPEFAGCDKVPPGELCTCRANVEGRTCSQCKPNTWDLQAYHPKGCVDCNCNMTGTLSLFNSCDQLTGQCQCKRFVAGQKCDLCADGFYNIRADSHIGCEPCNCDVGGAIGITCNQESGQCHCRPRIGGRRCDKPIQNHFFPTLWHHRVGMKKNFTVQKITVHYTVQRKQKIYSECFG
ncbi:hypothetical protein niasHT_010876 [Heterodera trifolii]|uniref:Uncharacterized protein n=1 Tax=Heterodera trifolii TaxID=157864 RepID=A0ABD2LJ56_9BILA